MELRLKKGIKTECDCDNRGNKKTNYDSLTFVK